MSGFDRIAQRNCSSSVLILFDSHVFLREDIKQTQKKHFYFVEYKNSHFYTKQNPFKIKSWSLHSNTKVKWNHYTHRKKKINQRTLDQSFRFFLVCSYKSLFIQNISITTFLNKKIVNRVQCQKSSLHIHQRVTMWPEAEASLTSSVVSHESKFTFVVNLRKHEILDIFGTPCPFGYGD